MDGVRRAMMRAITMTMLTAVSATSIYAQNFERYRPLTPGRATPEVPQVPEHDLPASNSDDRVLVNRLDAIIILDHSGKVSQDPSVDELKGISYEFTQPDSLVFTPKFQDLVHSYIGQAITLRSVNQLARDIAKYYQVHGQPIVDVQIPEQRITGGTLQIIVVEARIGTVMIQPGSVFSFPELNRWVECTASGQRVFEENLQSDLFWLNQNPFRRVTVDFEPGAEDGTTNIEFESHDVTPIRAYIGGDDTGVESLNYGRLFAGLMYGNLFGRGGLLSYQFTTDQEFAHLEAHSVSVSLPINRDYEFATYGSWASVAPMLAGGLTQEGQSWQLGVSVKRQLIRTASHSRSLSLGIDFKSSNNNLEFAGSTVADSAADLIQIRLGAEDYERLDQDQFRHFKADIFFGPGGGVTGAHSAAAFNTLRPGTSPDYVFGRISAEQTWRVRSRWMFRSELTAQASSERVLFSEMLGLGGFDTIRAFDQRATNADHGWIANFEFGPRTYRWGDSDRSKCSLRPYVFTDLGNGYLADAQPGEQSNVFLGSVGLGFRFHLSDRLNARFDWGHGWEDSPVSESSDRLHFGLTWIPGPRP